MFFARLRGCGWLSPVLLYGCSVYSADLLARDGVGGSAVAGSTSGGSADVADASPTDAGQGGMTTSSEADVAEVCRPLAHVETELTIDDFSAPDTWSAQVDGRGGPWFVFSDGTGSVTPASPLPVELPDNSGQGLHLVGTDLAQWGGGVGINLRLVGSTLCPLDASHTSGIAFTLQGTGTAQVYADSAQTVAVDQGGACSSTCGTFTAFVPVSSGSQRVELRWSDFQRGGPNDALDASRLFSLKFVFGRGSFDFWLSDVSFLPDSG